jgi:hypothetical protein
MRTVRMLHNKVKGIFFFLFRSFYFVFISFLFVLIKKGVFDEPVGPYPRGFCYSALEHGPVMWVNATLLEFSVLMFELFIRELTEQEKETHYQVRRMEIFFFLSSSSSSFFISFCKLFYSFLLTLRLSGA